MSQESDTGFYTREADIVAKVQRCRASAHSGVMHSLDMRRQALRGLLRMVVENTEAINAAVYADLGRHPSETQLMETTVNKNEIIYLLDHLNAFSKPEAPNMEGVMALMNAKIQRDPLGMVLIMGAWNYPSLLTINPLAGALAAGNTVILKPSEVSPATAVLLAELFPRYVSEDIVSVINGGVKETTFLLKSRFDHVFYTGSSSVGKIVMTAAAAHLTPVTLELGGKCPTIIDESCASSMAVVASRILWGKYVNAGQTCIAPDYVLIHRSVKAQFIQAFADARTQWMTGGGNANSVLDDAHYGRLVNGRHYQRVKDLMAHGKAVVGGEFNDAQRRIAPTLMDDVSVESPLMRDEIFGPLLPMITYDTKEEVMNFLLEREKPLALYIFSTNTSFINTVKTGTSSGAVVVNDVMLHAALIGIPFGGVGNSGMGSYHGVYSYECFSHRKSVLTEPMGLESIKKIRYPPYSAKKTSWLRWATEVQKETPSWQRVLYTAVRTRPVQIVALVAIGYAMGKL